MRRGHHAPDTMHLTATLHTRALGRKMQKKWQTTSRTKDWFCSSSGLTRVFWKSGRRHARW